MAADPSLLAALRETLASVHDPDLLAWLRMTVDQEDSEYASYVGSALDEQRGGRSGDRRTNDETNDDVIAALVADLAPLEARSLGSTPGNDRQRACTRAALQALTGTFTFDPSVPMLTIDLSRLGGSGDDTALVLAMTCASAWMESALADPHGGRRWVIYDEAWRVMRHVGLLERMQSQWKLSRGLGIANLMVIHRLSDLLSAGDNRLARPGAGRGPARRLQHAHHLPPGERPTRDRRLPAGADRRRDPSGCLAHPRAWPVEVAARTFIVQHILHPAEKALFDTDARMH